MASKHLRLGVGALLLTLSIAAAAENAQTTQPASVRAGPDDSYPEVAQLDADTPIQVMGCLDDWSWCDVAFDGSRGWLYSPDITYQYEGGYVPLYSYAPGLGVPVVSFTVDAYWGSHYHDRPWYRERDQWVHRTVHHQRPSGPPPSSSPPPREAVRMDRPHGGAPAERSLRLGTADPRPQEHASPSAHRPEAGPRPEEARRPEEPRRTEPRPEMSSRAPERPAAPEHPAPQHGAPPEHSAPDHAASEHSPAEHAGPGRAGPEHNEGHARSTGHAEPQRVEPQHTESQHAAPQHGPQHAEPQHHEEQPHPQGDKPHP